MYKKFWLMIESQKNQDRDAATGTEGQGVMSTALSMSSNTKKDEPYTNNPQTGLGIFTFASSF